jgi:hypothetical protein
MVSTGRRFRRPPAIACAFPIRPPRCRYSSVSTVNSTSQLVWKRSMSAEISSSVVPRASLRSIAWASIAIASDAVLVSITRTLSPISWEARSALWNVPDSVDETCSE